jgi:hypothetical protein
MIYTFLMEKEAGRSRLIVQSLELGILSLHSAGVASER